MQCVNPGNYTETGNYISTRPPCGTCFACLSNRRFDWASRLVIEAQAHSEIQFVTLTFRDECLPGSSSDLKPTLQKWLKRLGRRDGSHPRYFACMEYGTRFGRPHYHLILFGRPTTYERRETESGKPYYVDPDIEESWGLGLTYVKDCQLGSPVANTAIYVANYLLKDSWKTSGITQQQEWALQSRKPYIGKNGVRPIIELIDTRNALRKLDMLGTIPNRIKLCGRYWKISQRIRDEIGAYFGYPVFPVPYNDGTVIDMDGKKVLREISKVPRKFNEAHALVARKRQKIKNLRSRNKELTSG
jgi:hypothetical protein